MFKGTEYYMIVSIKDILSVFLCSMLPIIELRGSIILGAGLDLPWWINAAVSIIGNMLPIPFILIFIRRILHWMAHTKFPFLSKVALWIENKAHKSTKKVMRYATFGLFLFVAIPLPGTGAWTGALVAAMLDMRIKKSLPAIFLGVLCACAIMTLASYGFVGFLDFLTKI